MQTVLLAAGDGTRMQPLTAAVPKPLLSVAGEPLLSRIGRRAIEAGATALHVVVPPDPRRFTRVLGERVDDVPVEYVVQPRPTGPLNAVRRAVRDLDGAFVVLHGDTLYDVDALRRLYENVPAVGTRHTPHDDAASATRNDCENRDAATAVGDGGVSTIAPRDERGRSRSATGTESVANACAHAFPAAVHDWIRSGAEWDAHDSLAPIRKRLTRELAVTSVPEATHVDVDRPPDLLRATDHVLGTWATRADGEADTAADGGTIAGGSLPVEHETLEGAVASSAELHGTVHVADGASVRAGAVVEGPVVVGPDATIDTHAVVRGPAAIGRGVHVGHAASIDHTVVHADATVGDGAVLTDSIVGHGATIGPGTTVPSATPPNRSMGGDTRDGSRLPLESSATQGFGVVVGPHARTGVDTVLDPGVALPAWTSTRATEHVTAE